MNKSALTFDDNGYLVPYDTIAIDWQTILSTFAKNALRRRLLDDYRLFLEALRVVLPITHRQWIDGSFTSQRGDPADIDVIVFIPNPYFAEIVDVLKQLRKEWSGRIDCYFVEVFPPDHSKFDISRSDELTWYHFLRKDRRNRPKGFLELYVDYGDQ